VIETINLLVDKSWKILEPTTLNPRLSDDEYCRRLGLPGIHSIEFRRHIRNILRARRRKDTPDEEVLIAPELDPSGPHPLEPNLSGVARPRRPKGAKPPDGSPLDDEPFDDFEWVDPDRETDDGTKPADLVNTTSLFGIPDLPEEESFSTEEELLRLVRGSEPPHPYVKFKRLYTKKQRRAIDKFGWPPLHPVADFYALASWAKGPHVGVLDTRKLANLEAKPEELPVAVFYTRELADPEVSAEEAFVSARTKNLLNLTLAAHRAEDLLEAVITEEEAADQRKKDVEKIEGARLDTIHGELVAVKIGEPQTKIEGEKDAPPLTVDITSASYDTGVDVEGDLPDSIHRTGETAELVLIAKEEEREREERERELEEEDQQVIEYLCQARSLQVKERRRRVVEYAIEKDVSFRAAARRLGEPEKFGDEITRRRRRLKKRGREALGERSE